MVERLSDCSRLNEFNDFLEGMIVDRYCSGRKFVFVNDKGPQSSYTMNQLVARLDLCVRGSIGNQASVDQAVQKIKYLSNQADWHVKENGGCFFNVRQAIGNFFYNITHFGFDKAEVLKNIENHSIAGRQDVTAATINKPNDHGITPLNAVLMQDKKPSELYRDVKEMLSNGADPLEPSHVDNSFIFVKEQAKTGNVKPFEVLLSLVTSDQLASFISRTRLEGLGKETKLILVDIIHKRFGTCADFMYELDDDINDFLSIYKEYLESNPQLFIDDSRWCNTREPLIDYLKKLSVADKQFFESRFKSNQS